jgi:hypothetical protein
MNSVLKNPIPRVIVLASALFCSFVFAQAATSESKLPNGEPVLRMPFPAGTVVTCTQGNCSPANNSHSPPNCRYALDLENPTLQQEIVAAASGTISDVFIGSKTLSGPLPKAEQAREYGYGFGNYVKVDHGNGYFTFYAHLQSISVKKGDAIKTGEKIGIMGSTGYAGSAHLHFSLHQGDASQTGLAAPSVPMHALIAADLNGSGAFALMNSLEFVNVRILTPTPQQTHQYASENWGDQPFVFGPPPPELQKLIAEGKKLLLNNPDEQVASIVKEISSKGASWAIVQLEQVLHDHPDHILALYWAGFTMLDSGDAQKAKQHFQKIVKLDSSRTHQQPWILPWTYLRLAVISNQQGNPTEAKSLLEKASSFSLEDPSFEKMKDALAATINQK